MEGLSTPVQGNECSQVTKWPDANFYAIQLFPCKECGAAIGEECRRSEKSRWKDQHGARWRRGATARRKDINSAPEREDRIPGVRYDRFAGK